MPKPLKNQVKDRHCARQPVAVVDIGSNSVRLVVYPNAFLTAAPLYNEKALCGLGRGLRKTGKLNAAGVASAIEHIARFAKLANAMECARLDLFATAAVRDAQDGGEFVTAIRKKTGCEVSILKGEEEGRLSALGVATSFFHADGIACDLGGGSLEIARIEGRKVTDVTTLPLGPLVLMDSSGQDHARAEADIAACFQGLKWHKEGHGRDLFLVGGAWRNLARIHMEQSHYPLHLIHGYRSRTRQIRDFAQIIEQAGWNNPLTLPSVPKQRLDAFPYAALLLRMLIEEIQPREVCFSAYGLREGYVYDQIRQQKDSVDPLQICTRALAASLARSDHDTDSLYTWIAPLAPADNSEKQRLWRAACDVSDIMWNEHPDYRAVHGFWKILRYPFHGIEHHERAYLAYSVYTRYGGRNDEAIIELAERFMDGREIAEAAMLGRVLQLAYALSGGVIESLQETVLVPQERSVEIAPRKAKTLSEIGWKPSDTVKRRLKAVQKAWRQRERQSD